MTHISGETTIHQMSNEAVPSAKRHLNVWQGYYFAYLAAARRPGKIQFLKLSRRIFCLDLYSPTIAGEWKYGNKISHRYHTNWGNVCRILQQRVIEIKIIVHNSFYLALHVVSTTIFFLLFFSEIFHFHVILHSLLSEVSVSSSLSWSPSATMLMASYCIVCMHCT